MVFYLLQFYKILSIQNFEGMVLEMLTAKLHQHIMWIIGELKS